MRVSVVHLAQLCLHSSMSSLELQHLFDQFIDVSEALENGYLVAVLFQERTEAETKKCVELRHEESAGYGIGFSLKVINIRKP